MPEENAQDQGGAAVEENLTDQGAIERALADAGETHPGANEGPEQFRKKPDEKPAELPPDDPEFDLEDKAAEGGKRKLKLSELKKGYMMQEDYTRKTQELSAEREKHKDLIQFAEQVRGNPKMAQLIIGIVDKAITKNGYNNEFIDRQLGTLEQKIEQKQEQVQEKSDEIEKLLEQIDPESPVAGALRHQYAQNKALMKQLEDMGKKVSQVEKMTNERTQKEEESQKQAEVTRAKEVLETNLSQMADPKSPGGFEFLTDSEKARWRRDVAHALLTNRREYKSVEDFAVAIKEAGKAQYDVITKEREEIRARELERSKNGRFQKKEEPAKGESQPQKTLQEELEAELKAQEEQAGRR